MKDSFVLYREMNEYIEELTNEQAGVLLKALMKYETDEEMPDMDIATKVAFKAIKLKIDRDSEKYAKTCEARKEAGKLGGRPKKAKGYLEKAKKANGYFEKANENKQKQSKAKKPDYDYDYDYDSLSKDKEEVTPPQQIVNLYNEICIDLPKVTTISESRKKAINARLKKYTPDELKRVFEMAQDSGFLKGGNNRNWTANFDWLMNDTNIAKVLDGNYATVKVKQHDGFLKMETHNYDFANIEKALGG